MTNRDQLVINGRFLRATPTGLHRVARSLLTAALEAGLDARVMAPAGVSDPLVSRSPSRSVAAGRAIHSRARRMTDQAWEQTVLPVVAGPSKVLSLTNTAPLAARHSIVMVHDLAPLVGPQWFGRAMRGYGALVLQAARRAETVLTVSGQVADELRARGVTAPITLVRQAVDDIDKVDDAAVTEVRDRLGLRSPYLLMVGWADPRKDAISAIAAHHLARQKVEHDLVLVGLPHPNFAGVSDPRLDSVRVLGYVPDPDLAALLTGATALVYPSRYEGFGRPALEAWRCGTPALVSDIPAIREATHGRAVYLPPGDIDVWADAILAAVTGDVRTPEPDDWTWTDAARQLLAALGAG